MKWLRLYNEVLHDSKVQTLSPEVFRAWVNLLCLASAAEDRGTLPPVSQVAFSLRMKEEKAKQIIAQLVELELIDEAEDGSLSPHNWHARQTEKDPSTDRVRAYRNRIRANGETVTGYTKHRAEVFSRDGRACVYCLATKPLVLDHLVPVSRGGTGDADNLVTACKSCNSGKSGRLVGEAGYSFQRPETIAQYQAVLSRFGVTDIGAISSANATFLSRPVTVTVTPVTPLEEIRLEERRLEQPPLPPGGGVAVAVLAPLGKEARAAIEEARDRFGDKVAELVQTKARVIDTQLGGRFDLFLDALDAASHHEPPLTHVFSWCMTRAKAKINQPPKADFSTPGKPVPPNRGAEIPGEAESKGCEHCSGIGQATVYHPKPDPANRVPETTTADCVCPRGRLVRSKRDAKTAARIPDLADVLAGQSVWLADPVFVTAAS